MTEAKKTVSQDTKATNEVAKARQKRDEAERVPLKRIGKTETITVEDFDGPKDYTFFFPGLKKAHNLVDFARMGNGVIDNTTYNEGLMKTVIVEPKTDWDYWDEHDGYGKVMDEADRFLGEWLRK
ncbi:MULTISPECIES: hypothetical protein [Levilactobacillus]|uniref:Minor capsid protein n=1 Tax=Levilactobacillus fuyuanensis TaxID=2486022 RepID=A0ABW4GZQ7_9LACO|nr:MULTISPECIES: hypothetical protein [Levilactobacillus]ARW50296.1 hypothetical protein S101106_00788 [Levilactobacillus brevis]ULH75553.1 hypothetical protein MD222_11970 [Levilactobacillus brevis]